METFVSTFNDSQSLTVLFSQRTLLYMLHECFIRKKRLVNIAPGHCFDVALANFEQIINNDFIQLEAE